MKRYWIFIIFFTVHISFAQYIQLTDDAQVSMITIEPGKNLYDTFGHSAIRIKDPNLGIDQGYNYGMYDFNKPNFYLNFAKGKLEYDLGAFPFRYFLDSYKAENRSVVEQVLLLTSLEKQQFFEYLETNALPQNKSYLYDFLYDNCATKLPEVTKKILGDKLQFHYTFGLTEELTFRDLIHAYTKEHPWGTFGIDLALGSKIDQKISHQAYTFLPDYVFKAFQLATLKSGAQDIPLVTETRSLYTSTEKVPEAHFFTPVLVFSLITILIAWITYRDRKQQKRSRWLDFILFFISGMVGTLMLLLWFATDHHATAQNYNILWAFAPNLIMAFMLVKKQPPAWVSGYSIFLLFLLLLLMLLWILKIQVFATGLLPLLIALSIRYLYLLKNV